MRSNIEHKFNSPNEELEWLRNRYKEESLEAKKGEKMIEEQELAAKVLYEHIRKEPEKTLGDNYKLSAKEQESLVAKILNLAPESHDKKIEELLAVAEGKGILNAVSIARNLKDPHLEDDLHRALIQFYIKGDVSKQKIKKPLSQALDMVLYEISLPQEKEEDKKEKNFKEFISAMEQFYGGMMILDKDKEEYFALEIGLPVIGEEIVFYAAVPRSKSSLMEKQISALFANARIEEKREDYNIFKPGGVSAGSAAKLKTYPVLPIRTYDKFDVDPMFVIANAFSKLRKIGEGASLQIVIGPADSSYGKKIKKTAEEIRKGKKLFEALKKAGIVGTGIFSFIGDFIFSDSSSKKDDDEKGKEKERKMETVNEDVAKMIEEKASRPMMSANLRILVSADSQEKSDSILKEIESAFLQFTEPQGNALKFRNLKGKELENLFYKFSFRLFDKNEAFYLNTAEMATVFHFPKGISTISQLKYVKAKDAPPPLNLPQEGILLGKNFYRGDESLIYMKDDDRRRHFYLIGQTGTGKSVLLKNMIVQDMEQGKGVCYIDPHGSDLEDILSRIPKDRVEDLIYFDPAGRDRTMGLNMLEYDSAYPEQKTFIVNELLGIFNKLFDMKIAGGPMFEQYFRNSALLAMDDPESGNTLLEISRVMSNKAFRDLKLSRCRNLSVKLFWKDVAEKAGGEASLVNIVPYITSKFDNFLGNDIMRPIIAQEKSSFDFRKIMDEKKILLINLSKGRLGDINSHLLGLIIVGKLLMAALSRADIPESERNDFYLYIDEFQNVTTDSIAVILSEARKYKLNLTIAHQFIGQLEENIKKAVFGNVGSMGAFRVGAEDGEFLAKQFEPVFDAGDLLNIDNYRAYLKLLIEGQSTRPFSVATLPFQKGDVNFGKEAALLSLARYGRLRSQVDEEINKKFNA
ncbi:MAG: hypothetical protein A2Z62_01915 [Candidatus Terrybacteria bacterium RIFCSPLOWO2_02_42_20]|uniref:DUF8128 domain-containing protein n=1 Tax=Candidatus Terrybacteria bacterium RIFCSPLOWO2_02_42_20 TaxID=1802370 RepID=A0A1G2PZP4_9BACT|nr:MAG: hypothetical protein A2Z62_01915 [Candidatus Terrybacteria bacterium RIFCSPLOWO2_02_42_20]